MLLSRGFDIALMHYNEHKLTTIFLDSLASNSHLPCIIQPSWNKSNFRTLTENIFSYVISKGILSSNVTTAISDHQLHFLISPSKHIFDISSNKFDVFERDWSDFDQDYSDIDWSSLFKPGWKMLPLQQIISLME